MSRAMTTAMQAAVKAESASVVHLIQLDFAAGTVRFTTAPHDLRWAGYDWFGVGGALGFESVEESADLSAAGVQLSLSGVDRTVTGLVLNQQYIGRNVDVYMAYLDAVKQTIIDAPLLLFRGFMNGEWTITETHDDQTGSGTVTVTTRCEGRLGELEQRRGLQTNPESLGAFFPGDKFFDYVADLKTKQLPWGRPEQ